jgi:hypothetical protein
MDMDLEHLPAISGLSSEELTARVVSLARHERAATAVLVAHLAEFDRRHLYLPLGYSSMFGYCTGRLGMAEGAAYKRIQCCRLLRRYPAIYGLLREGSLNVSGLHLLAPRLLSEADPELLVKAKGLSCRRIAHLVADLSPAADVPTSIRRLPTVEGAPGSDPAEEESGDAWLRTRASRQSDRLELNSGVAPPDHAGPLTGTPRPVTPDGPPSTAVPGASAPPSVTPLGAARWRVQFTAGVGLHGRLREAQELMRHQVPNGDLAAIIDRAVVELLKILRRRKFAALMRSPATPATEPSRTDVPRTEVRRFIPAAIRRAVWQRDGGACTYVSEDGTRCLERGKLEFHHVRPFADGGPGTLENLVLRCRAHNMFEAGKLAERESRSPMPCESEATGP